MNEDKPVVPEKNIIVFLTESGVPEETAKKIQENLGALSVDDLAFLKESDLVGIGMKTIQARRFVKQFAAVAPTNPAAPAIFGSALLDDILPIVPGDTAWLEMLKAGGVLKVDDSSVISAVHAALAHKAGLFNVLERIITLMEEFSEKNENPIDPSFYRLKKDMTRKTYAEIFSAIDGLDGSFVSETRKRTALKRIEEHLLPALFSFYGHLKNWHGAWNEGAMNPMNLYMMISGNMGGLPPGMLATPPDTGILRDAASDFNTAANKVFAGCGVPVVAAIAYDAMKIREALANTGLPAMIGATDRDHMLKLLGSAVAPTYPRLEQVLTRFALAILKVKDLAGGENELRYFGSMCIVGSQINWDQLGMMGSTNGRVRR